MKAFSHASPYLALVVILAVMVFILIQKLGTRRAHANLQAEWLTIASAQQLDEPYPTDVVMARQVEAAAAATQTQGGEAQ